MKRLTSKINAGIITLMLILGLAIAATPIISPTPTVQAQVNCKEQNEKGILCIPKPKTLPGPTDTAQNKTYFRDILLVQITRTLVSLAGGLALLFFIFGGVQMLTAFGNEDTYGKAKKTLIWSVIGFLITMFSYTIVSIIGNIEITPNQAKNATTQTTTTPTTPTTSTPTTPPPPTKTNQK